MQDRQIGIGHGNPPVVSLAAPWLASRRAVLRRRARHAGRAGHGGLPDLERALVNPAAVFAEPRDVLHHPRLLRGCKREILRRWAWDEHLKDLAASEGMSEGEPSRLDEVRVALLSLGETWRPRPFTPAAPRPCLLAELGRDAA